MAVNRDGPMVTVYTQAYNTKPYLEQCINSVLSQTYSNFEYILMDNGCTDGSSEIIDAFAQKDPRIHAFHYQENIRGKTTLFEKARELARGEYYTWLDSDDWWEPDYLEKLIAFAEKNNLDIACTRTVMHVMATGEQNLRKFDQPLVVPRERFADTLPWYHVFFRPLWGKLIRTTYLKNIPLEELDASLQYGGDTLLCFRLLRRIKRMGVDSSLLHHYRIHKKSKSYQYNSKRFASDVYLYELVVDFLSDFGPVSAKNRHFLQRVYSYALSDTIDVISNSSLAPMDKLRE